MIPNAELMVLKESSGSTVSERSSSSDEPSPAKSIAESEAGELTESPVRSIDEEDDDSEAAPDKLPAPSPPARSPNPAAAPASPAASIPPSPAASIADSPAKSISEGADDSEDSDDIVVAPVVVADAVFPAKSPGARSFPAASPAATPATAEIEDSPARSIDDDDDDSVVAGSVKIGDDSDDEIEVCAMEVDLG